MPEFFKIAQLSQLTGISLETIRYYEKIQLLPSPQRASNGYRLFTKESLHCLQFIKTCRSLGFSLDEIRQLNELRKDPHNNCHNANQIANEHLVQIDEKIKQLNEMKAFLTSLSNCQENSVERCKVLKGIGDFEHSHELTSELFSSLAQTAKGDGGANL